MKIHGICLVKNEADIVGQTLKAALGWCDFIYVLDNGSTDDSWEIVKQLSHEYEQVIPYKQDLRVYNEGLMRSEVFRQYRSNSSEEDWWCASLDADEIYIDDPKIFLAKVPSQYEKVWSASFQYYFTDKDLA